MQISFKALINSYITMDFVETVLKTEFNTSMFNVITQTDYLIF